MKTFGDLKEGQYLYTASRNGVGKKKISMIIDKGDIINVQLDFDYTFSHYLPKEDTGYHYADLHLYVSKKDAEKKSYELMLQELQEMKQKVEDYREFVNRYKEDHLT